MALTFQDVLNDAKKLTNRLNEHDSTADALVSQMQAVYQQVEAMKQYHEDISQLNDLASERPRMALVAGIQQESKHITDLQQENRELRIALEEQQNAVDMIMSKYREHVSKLIECKRLDEQLLNSMDTNNKTLESNTERMNEMKFIMRKAISMDEESLAKEEGLLSKLWTENKGLREMLEISRKYGSYGSNILSHGTTELDIINKRHGTEDKEVQTSWTGIQYVS